MASSLFGGARTAAPAMGSNTVGANPQMLQAAQSVKRMMGALRAAKNPQAAIMQVAQQNPMLGGVMQMVGGKNPQDVFTQECQKHGLDPNQAMQQIKSMLGN